MIARDRIAISCFFAASLILTRPDRVISSFREPAGYPES
jgi:hypothetical protein